MTTLDTLSKANKQRPTTTDEQEGQHIHPLYTHYQAAIASNPTMRARELAKALNTTEGDLVACRQGLETWVLKAPYQNLLGELHTVGEVMTITRNDEAVHETSGTYHKFSFMPKGKTGLVLSSDIDLRLFIGQWHSAFHVIENKRHSIQFFNENGIAVHKIYRTQNTLADAWNTLLTEFTDTVPNLPHFTPITAEDLNQRPLPEAFNQSTFAEHWATLKDVHDYHAMLKKFALTRTQAVAQIGEKWAVSLTPESVEKAIGAAKEKHCEIMVFVGNSGCVQIFSGTIDNLLTKGPWFNVLDPRFNLHLRHDLIHEAWAIKRPSSDGIITSIEAFNAKGDTILTLFGKRKPGVPELPLWREIVNTVTPNM